MSTIFHSCRLIDCVHDRPRTACDVVVEGGRIVAVEPTRDWAAGEHALIPAEDLTLLPGLIDCHCHYVLDPWQGDPFSPAMTEPEAAVALRAARNARLALDSGVTTARDAGAPRGLNFALRDAIAAGWIPGPRLLSPGRAITITGGHGYKFGTEADGPLELQKAVRAEMRAGADAIKIIASEAAMLTGAEAGVEELTQAEIEVIVSEASRRGLRTFSHAQNSTSVIRSARAGVHSVEHAFLANEEATRALQACGTTLVPTLAVTEVTLERTDISDAFRQRMLEIQAAHWASCERAISEGVNVSAGTDCGVTAILPDMLWREIRLLHQRGLSPMGALRAATIRAAELLGVASEVGSLEPGKQADLIAVHGDPLEDLGCLERPAVVMKAGQIVRHRLSAWEA